MAHHPGRQVSVALAMVLVGCGYVGEPLPPALNIPVPVPDLSAKQQGVNIVITFTVPNRTTEGLLMPRPGAVELEVGGRAVPVAKPQFGFTEVKVSALPYAGTEIPIRVRTLSWKGRHSEWTEISFRVVPPLETPSGLTAKADPEGIRLSWSAGRATSFRVFRDGVPLSVTATPEFLDSTVEWGKSYEYAVSSLLDRAESERSAPVRITPEDRFPPAVPSGLQAAAGISSVELSWDPNTESDLKGYRVYRSVSGEPWTLLSGLVEAPGYSDKTVKPGKTYAYAVTAVDLRGNESARSAPVEIQVPAL